MFIKPKDLQQQGYVMYYISDTMDSAVRAKNELAGYVGIIIKKHSTYEVWVKRITLPPPIENANSGYIYYAAPPQGASYGESSQTIAYWIRA